MKSEITVRRFSRELSRGKGRAAAANRFESVQTGSVVFELKGANARAVMQGQEKGVGTVNYLIGSDKTEWSVGVPVFARVKVEGVYPGIDLVYYGNQEELEYDFVVGAGADAGLIHFSLAGAKDVRVGEDGDLVLDLGHSELRHRKPVAYQVKGGQRIAVQASYRISAGAVVSFQLGSYDRTLPLVIDPVLEYSSYFGGKGTDVAWDVVLGAGGTIYVAGETRSPKLAGMTTVTNSYQSQYGGGLLGGGGDAFVACIDRTGTNLLYLTYIGGPRNDAALALAVDQAGSAYITGVTDSTNFPTRLAISNNISGKARSSGLFAFDAFVTKLNPTGTDLEFSTYLGGNGQDQGLGIALGSDNSVYVTGYTISTNFPVANAFQAQLGRTNKADAFVTRISPDGSSFIYSTYLGGTNTDHGEGIAVDLAGRAFVTGYTTSTNFPTTPDAFQGRLAGGEDAFLSILEADGSSLVSSTYFGGMGKDVAFRAALDPQGNAYIVGSQSGFGFPVSPTGIVPGGIYRSVNGGATWEPSSTGLWHNDIPALALHPATPSRIYAGTWRGIYVSDNSGESWESLIGYVGTPVYEFAMDPLSPSTLYALGPAVAKSTDFGRHWMNASTGIVGAVSHVLVDQVNPSVLYAGTETGVYKSTNAAGSWQYASRGLPRNYATDIVQDPQAPEVLYAATPSGVYRSTDAAGSWQLSNAGIGSARPVDLAIDPKNPSTLYARTVQPVSSSKNRTDIYKTIDSGAHWTSVGGPALYSVGLTEITVDPVEPTTLYVGSGLGPFKSTDAGQSWMAISNGLPLLGIYTIVADPTAPGTLYAGTYNTNAPAYSQVQLTENGISYRSPGEHAFVARFGANPYSVVLTSKGTDKAWDVATDGAGNVYVVGTTTSKGFPVFNTGSLSVTNRGQTDCFISALRPDASGFLYSGYLGGKGNDYAFGVHADALGNLAVVGQTSSTTFPVTTNAFRRKFLGTSDAFISRLSAPSNPH